MFGQLVRTYRRQLGMSQEDLAQAAGLSVRGVGKIENDRVHVPRPATVRMLANALGLTGAQRAQFFRAATYVQAAPGLTVPRQLPANVPGFTGRLTELEKLDDILLGQGDHGSALVISVIGGGAGVGKTALAIHWAHRWADKFPDGQLYANLRGFAPMGSPVDPAAVVRGFLDALGVSPAGIPADTEAQFALYRSMLADRRMLVLLDNARDADHVRPLLPGSAGSVVLVTSRNRLSSLVATEAARSLTLGVLTNAEARDLLVSRLGADRVAAEPRAVNDIIARCARLPLALVIVAARAAIHPDFPLMTLADHLGQDSGPLDILTGDDPYTDIRSVFSWSYRTLSPEAARLFRLLGQHPGPDIGTAAVASLAGVPGREVQGTLDELTRAHLIIEHAPGRYAFHDLLRSYAAELAHSVNTSHERRAAQARLLDHYVHTAWTAALLLWPPKVPITLDPVQEGTVPEPLRDLNEAQSWFVAERAVLMAAVPCGLDHGFDVHAWRLAWALEDFLDRRGDWRDLAAVQQAGLRAATRAADLGGQARMHHGLARAYLRLSKLAEAATHLRSAYERYGDLGDEVGQADTIRNLALVQERQGNLRDALASAKDALRLYTSGSHTTRRGQTLNGIGWLHAKLGDYAAALSYCRQALALLQQSDDPTGLADTWDSLGYIHQRLGQHTEAIDCFRQAIRAYRDLGHNLHCANSLICLGETQRVAGDEAAAQDSWRQAMALLSGLDGPDADELRQRLEAVAGWNDGSS